MDHRGSINSDENIHTVGAGGGSSNHNGTGLDRDLGAAPGVVHYAFSSSKRDFLAPDPFSPQPAPHRNGAVAVPAAPAAEASPDPSPRSAPARYRECLRNHAASVGGLVVDGCGEFLPAESDALKCSVCGCHRSFHRREPEPGEAAAVATIPRHAAPPPYYYHPYSLSNGGGRRAHGGGGGSGARLRPGAAPPPLLALPPPQSRPQPLKPSPIMSFRGGGGGNESSGGGGSDTDSSSEEMDAYTPVTPAPAHPAPWTQPPPISSRKRFRTKFTSEQKERMLEFAGALGWRMQRRDEGAVERFCAEVGVPRKVFKVWMHNNKHASTAKPLPPQQHQIHPPAADPFSRPPQQQQQQLPHADTYTRPPQQHAQADAYSRPHADTYARPHPPSSPP